jgi:hypothetical protein
LISCEFPYNRTNIIYHEIEYCQGAYIHPPLRRLGHIHLQDYRFHIELRNNNGIIEHRMTKPNALQSGAKSRDIEALFRYAIMSAGWNYKEWAPTPIPGSADDFSRGVYLGEKTFQSKYSLFTCAAIDNLADYQEVEVKIVDFRGADSELWARAASYSSQAVSYRMPNYSAALKIELRNGTGPATNLLASLPNENNGSASLVVRVEGKFYEQGYGLV